MKNIILSVAAFFALSTAAIAQDSIQTISRLNIDSTLTVGDSANFGSKVTVEDQMTIKGTTEMMQAATARNDLRVEGELFLPNLSAPADNRVNFLFSDPADGRTYRGDAEFLTGVIYSPKFCPNGNEVIPNPTWANGTNKIYVECPQVFVGIGTNAPAYNLDNRGTTKLYGHTWLNSTASIGADNDNFSRLYIKNTNYGAALHLNNSGNTGNYNKLLFFEYSNPTTEVIKVTNTASSYDAFVLSSSGAMTINNGTYNTFQLGADGQLIIRNASQKNFQFDVNGLFRARRVKVDADSWADFVFEPTYELMPLPEVKTYVEENKHLPGVPSEQEVLEQGVDLADMNKVLIQKIEELMLYTIDQNQSLTELKAEVEALKAKITVLEGQQ